MGLICVFTGDGKGKTSAAFGMAIRFLGHGKRVSVVQFLKGRKTGEILVKKNLPGLDIVQFGTEEFVNLNNPSKEDKQRAIEALLYAKKLVKGPYRPNLLILDEINIAMAYGLIEESDVLELLSQVPEDMTVVLTGRKASEKIIEKADLVTEMKDIKHPFKKGEEAKEGIEF
ncbi:MAG: cob(I)yrinic acid a,c-diamide adenosyltransferase [Candidatus Aenigmatarchaeota archaeon]